MTEEEQIENIKKLWKKYGNLVLTLFLICVIGIFSWQWWQRHTAKQTQQASQIYEQMIDSVLAKDDKGTQAFAETLLKRHPKTSYADIAALTIAKFEVEKKQYDQASKQFQVVIDNSKFKTFRQIARVRLARILLTQKKYDAGLKVLKKIDDASFQAIVADLNGDFYLAQGKQEKARMAYITALQEIPKLTLNHSLTQMKLLEIADPEHHVAERRSGGIA